MTSETHISIIGVRRRLGTMYPDSECDRPRFCKEPQLLWGRYKRSRTFLAGRSPSVEGDSARELIALERA